MKKVPLHLRVTEELRSQLEAAAEVTGTTPNIVAAILLSQALNHGKSNTSEQHIREATQPYVAPSAAGLLEALAKPEDVAELLAAAGAQEAANVAAIVAFVNEEK